MEIQQLKNAITVIKQMRRGEWVAEGFHDAMGEYIVIRMHRRGVFITLEYGASGCRVFQKPWELGYFGRWVWRLGAKRLARNKAKQMRRKASVMTD